MNVLIDAVGIRGHGAANILKSILNKFSELRPDWHFYIYLYPKRLLEFNIDYIKPNIQITHIRFTCSSFSRYLWLKKGIRNETRKTDADLIFSFANIGSYNPQVPQITYLQQANIFHLKISIRHLYKYFKIFVLKKFIIKGINNSSYVIVQTDDMAKNLKKINNRFEQKVKVIPSGYVKLSSESIISDRIKEQINKITSPKITYISHPSEHKNHLNLVKAFAEILKIFPNASLLLTLENDSVNMRYRKFVDLLKTEGIRLGIIDKIYFLGNLNHDEIYYLLQNCDIMAFPSLAESFGLGLVEAMYMKCPIAASDLPYAHDVAGKAAVYFNPLDPKSIAETIIKLISNRGTLDLLKENAAKEIIRFDYNKIASDIINLMQESKKG